MASRKLRFAGDSGYTAGAAIRNDNDQIWNGSAMVTETLTPVQYATNTPVPEVSSGYYSTNVPTNLPIGKYHVAYHDLDSGDVLFQAIFQWDGGAIVDDITTGESVAAICNKALRHLGVSTVITNLDTDTSTEGVVLRDFYSTALSKILRDFTWPFAVRSAALSLVDEDPTTEWAYSYRKPTNAVRILRIPSGVRNDTRGTITKTRHLGDDTGGLLYLDTEDAEIEYVALVTNPLLYPPDFILAFSFLLASYCAPTLSGIDARLGIRAEEKYKEEIRNAWANAANEETIEEPAESSFISGRE